MLTSLIQGTKLVLTDKTLWPFMAYPILAAIFLWFVLLFVMITVVAGGLLHSFVDPSWGTLGLFLLSFFGFLAFTVFLFPLLNFFLSFFNTQLARKCIQLYGFSPPLQELSVKQTIQAEIRKLTIVIPGMIGGFLISFVPGVGILLSGLITGFFFTFQFLDYSHEVMLTPGQERIRYAWDRKWKFAFLGILLSPILLLPFLNFFAIPWTIAVTSHMRMNEEIDHVG